MNLVLLIIPFIVYCVKMYVYKLNKGNNKITELRTILHEYERYNMIYYCVVCISINVI
jgi:hypothetical protein